MEAYTLDWQKGQLIQDRMQEANYKRISDKKIDDTMKVQIMNLKEYEQIKEYIPHKKNLLYSMNHVRYCKVDSFHDCVQGIMRVPDLKNHEMFVFGFCMYKQTLYFVEETNQIQLLMEHVKNDVYKNCRLHEVLLMILNYLIDDDVYRMQKIEEQLEKIEENVIGHVQKHLDERIMKYRKHFSELMVSYDQMTNMGEHMQLYMNRNEIQDEEMGWERYVHRTERLHQYAAEKMCIRDRRSVGRTDFPNSSQDAIVRSVRERLFALPDDTIVYPGHMGETKIEYEKLHNPYVQEG